MRAPCTRISVVIPAYNVRDYLRDAAESALAQTHAPIEVIIVDDGSTDGTLQVARDLEVQHPDLVRVLTGPNRGATAARNQGLAEASGEYIQFLDADDVLAPDKLQSQVDLVRSHDQPDVVAGSYERHLLNGEKQTIPAEPEDVWVALARSRLGITSSNLWKASTLRAAGGWNAAWRSSQEYELMFRLLRREARFAIQEDVQTIVNEREGSISSAFDGPVFRRYVDLRVAMAEHLASEGLLVGGRRAKMLERVFILLRRLYWEDREAALELHRRVIPPDFSPRISGANTWRYVATYRLLGFRRAERLRTNLRALVTDGRWPLSRHGAGTVSAVQTGLPS